MPMPQFCKSRLMRLLLIGLVFTLTSGAKPVPPPERPVIQPANLTYSQETTWRLPTLPNLTAAAGTIPHNFSQGEEIFVLENETIHGFRPGKVYDEMYVRDIAWGMEAAQYYYPDHYLREPIEAYLRRQYSANTRSLDGDFGVLAGVGAIGGIITPEGESNKQTITTDEETSLIHAAYLYYQIAHNTSWLQNDINGMTIINRLNLAADWLYGQRLDPQLQMLWRGHTTDWGDVKFEKSNNYTDYDPSQDHLTASIYDQALAVMALRELAEMNAAAGDTERAALWEARAEALKESTNAHLWQEDRGFYLTHAHVTSLDHDFDEANMVSISNALAVYTGLTDFDQAFTIFQHLERVQDEAGATKPGVSIYPYYPNQWPYFFFDYLGMGYGNYQNGGQWDWWGGVQIKAEFQQGFAEAGQTHLLQVVNDWQAHPGNIIEWQSTTDSHHEGSHYYSAAAGTMGSAIIEGFFGLELDGTGLTMQPRLGMYDGFVRVYQPATDRYAAYDYDWNQEVTRLDYGTNAYGPVQVKILMRPSEQVQTVTINGAPIAFSNETVGNDTYVVFAAPAGENRIELIKGGPPAPALAEITNDTTSAPAQIAVAESQADTVNAAPAAQAAVNDDPVSVNQATQPEATFDEQVAAQPAAAEQTLGEEAAVESTITEADGIEAEADLGWQAKLVRYAENKRFTKTELDLLQFGFTALIVLASMALLVVVGVRLGRRQR